MKFYPYWLLVCALLSNCSNPAGPTHTSTPSALSPCADKPNCVCSCETRTSFQVAPIAWHPTGDQPLNLLLPILNQLGHFHLEYMTNNYLHGTFTSRIFRFKDDFEVLYQPKKQQIEVRSASRTGYSDLGVNRKRVNQFQALVSP